MNSGVQCVLDDVPAAASPTASPQARRPVEQGTPEYFEAIISTDELGFTLHRDVSIEIYLFVHLSLSLLFSCSL